MGLFVPISPEKNDRSMHALRQFPTDRACSIPSPNLSYHPAGKAERYQGRLHRIKVTICWHVPHVSEARDAILQRQLKRFQ